MLTAADFITLPYPSDLTRAGIEYALRSLAFGRVSGSPDDLRRLVAARSADLALRRHLDEQGIRYGLAQVSDPLSPQVILGGKRLIFQVTLIADRHEIRTILRQPEQLLSYEAHLPEEVALPEEDLILQVFALSLVAHSEEETKAALAASQPACLIRPFPSAWAQNHTTNGLGKVALKADTPEPAELELVGTSADLDYQTERLTLPPLERCQAETAFQSLACLSSPQLIKGRVAVRSPNQNEVITAQPLDWHNLWLYGMKIIAAGALTVREMRRLLTLNIRKSESNQKIALLQANPLVSYQ